MKQYQIKEQFEISRRQIPLSALRLFARLCFRNLQLNDWDTVVRYLYIRADELREKHDDDCDVHLRTYELCLSQNRQLTIPRLTIPFMVGRGQGVGGNNYFDYVEFEHLALKQLNDIIIQAYWL